MKIKSKLQVVTVVGTIGAGKSTAMPLIVKALGAHAVEADDFFQTSNPFRDDYLQDLPRWSLANETWLTLERAEMMNREKGKAVKMSKEWMVVDSGLVMSYAYMKMHLVYKEVVEAEWRLFERVYEQVSRENGTDVVVWLDVSTKTAMERVQRRGRDYELEYYNLDYLSNLRETVESVVDKLESSGVRVVRLGEEIGNIVESSKDRKRLVEVVKEGLGEVGNSDSR